jgi:hypothetical protein
VNTHNHRLYVTVGRVSTARLLGMCGNHGYLVATVEVHAARLHPFVQRCTDLQTVDQVHGQVLVAQVHILAGDPAKVGTFVVNLVKGSSRARLGLLGGEPQVTLCPTATCRGANFYKAAKEAIHSWSLTDSCSQFDSRTTSTGSFLTVNVKAPSVVPTIARAPPVVFHISTLLHTIKPQILARTM